MFSYSQSLFEILTSEASYQKSLNLVISHFMAAEELDPRKGSATCVLQKHEHHTLFSNIVDVRDVSKG